jgi:peptide chain release factor 1
MSKLPIQQILNRYQDLSQQISTAAPDQMMELGKKHKRVGNQAEIAEQIDKLENSLEQNRQSLAELNSGDELAEMIRTEISEQEQQITELENKLLILLSPADTRDDNNILLEIRAGAGGDESSLFAAEMIKMYSVFSANLGLNFKLVETSMNPLGGYKEAIAEVKGDMAFAWFKYEGGVHRVQRVPATEKQGRIHTSTVSVAIMPLIEKDSTFKLDPKDIEIILSTSSGNGGQSVNTTYSAVRMKHLPTGMEAQSQDERNQLQNREKALQVLTSRVYDFLENKRREKESAERKEQVGTADRSEKIRTYNFPQDRLTDHRYNLNYTQLDTIMSGKLLPIVEDIKRVEAENNLSNLAQQI